MRFNSIFIVLISIFSLFIGCVSTQSNNEIKNSSKKIELKNIIKDSNEKELYEFKLESIQEKYSNYYFGIFSFISKVEVTLRGSYNYNFNKPNLKSNENDLELDFEKKYRIEDEFNPFAPNFYRKTNMNWEKYDYGFLCGTGVETHTLKANKKYKLFIPLHFYFNNSGEGIVTINSLKSDIFNTKLIHEAIGRQNGSESELIVNNPILKQYFFDHKNFKSLNLISKENFDTKDLAYLNRPLPIEISTYVTLDKKFTIIITDKIFCQALYKIDSKDIAIFENTTIPQLHMLYTVNKKQGRKINEGVIIFSALSYAYENIKYSDSDSEVLFEKPIVFKILNHKLPPYPHIYTPSIHTLGPKLFPNDKIETRVIEISSYDSDLWPIPFYFSGIENQSLTRLNEENGKFDIILKDELFSKKITWSFINDKFIKREHYRKKQSWEN